MADPPPDADLDMVGTGAFPPVDPDEIEVLGEEECLRLLGQTDLGRVAFAAGGRVHIFPVNYAATADAIVFRTAAGLKLEAMPLGRVAFEIDGVDRAHSRAWSVIVHGVAHDITDALDDASGALRRLVVTPQAPGERLHWIQIRTDDVTGRRFDVPAPGRPPSG